MNSKPGKELDALVAEKVMGECGHILRDFRPLGYSNYGPNMCCTRCHKSVTRGEIEAVPNYSTNIKDAWRVVEKLQGLSPVFRGDSYEWFAIDAPIRNEENSDRWLVGWKYHYAYEGDEWYCQEDGLTVMEAICKAALARMLDERI